MRRFHHLALLLPALLVAACGDTPSSPDDDQLWYSRYEIGYVDLGRTRTLTRDSVIVREEAVASFMDMDSVGLFAGRVTANGVNLPMYRTPDPGGIPRVLYRLTSDSGVVPLAFGGTLHRIVVEGGTRIPPIADSISSPMELEVARPTVKDTLSRAAGFDIAWNDAGSQGGTTMRIIVIGLGDTATIIEHMLQFEVPDEAGHFTIPTWGIADFPLGNVGIIVKRIREQKGKTRPAGDTRERKYRMGISSAVTMSLPMIE